MDARLEREDPAAPLMPDLVWRSSFDDFLGPHAIGETFAIDGRSSDYAHAWDAVLHPRAYALVDGYAIHVAPDQDLSPLTVRVRASSGADVGFVCGQDVWVDPEHRGRGLGAEMILVYCDAHAILPSHSDGVGLTEAAATSCETAWTRAVRRAERAGQPVPAEHLRDTAIFETEHRDARRHAEVRRR